jgi:hypothetical protein
MLYKNIIFVFVCCIPATVFSQKEKMRVSKTEVTIVGEQFYINGEPTFKGRTYNGMKVEGLLPNSRMVQGIFDDLNDSTRSLWAYPDTKVWDADRNTNEFVKAMSEWRNHGLLAFTLNLQGGSPYGYSNKQPWHNSAIDSTGLLRKEYMMRLRKILNQADELGMVCILGLFYFGQDERVKDEAAVKNAVSQTINWLHRYNYRNVVIEINNECNPSGYNHEILKPQRVHELIELVRNMKDSVTGHRYLVTTSFVGKQRPSPKVMEVSDFLLVHGNGISKQDTLTAYYMDYKKLMGDKKMPIVNNEDDHFNFDKSENNMITSFKHYVSWGYFDFRKKDEPFETGYQSMPASWKIDTDRKKGFFGLLAAITGIK